jgi:hypothetical protein
MITPHSKKIKTCYEAQFLINSMLKDEIKKKITWVNPGYPTNIATWSWDQDKLIKRKLKEISINLVLKDEIEKKNQLIKDAENDLSQLSLTCQNRDSSH